MSCECEWQTADAARQDSLGGRISFLFFTLKAELDCVFNIKMPLRFAVLLDDMLPVLIPTD